MALPDGVTSCTVTAGVPVTHTGAAVKTFVSIEPSAYLVHAATGTPLVDFLEELSIAEGVAGQFTLPHTDQAGFTDENGNAYTNWYYTARVTYSTPSKAKNKAPKIKVFQLTTGQTEVDLDKLPGGAPALPYSAPTAKVTSFNGRTDAVTLQETDLPARLAPEALAATAASKAPIAGARPGSRIVTLGDSITQGADDYATKAQGISWPHYMGLFSGQRASVVQNAGIAGNNTAQMLARFDTDVTPYNPTAVVLLAGTNDVGQGRSFADWSADVVAIVAKIRAIGAVPVLGTIPPNNGADRRQQIGQFNTWLRSYAASQGLTVIPFYALLVDPANGSFKSAYYSDGTHPSTAGQIAMGQLAADTLAPLLPVNSPPITSDDVDANNNIALGCFTAGAGSTLPAGWTDGAGIPAGSVLSYVTDAQVPGQMVKITQTATAGLRQLIYSQYLAATTLSNATSVGATSLVLPVRADYRGTLFIGSGATFEIVKILSSSGAGPQTETLVTPLKYAHAAGEPVVANGAPGDVLVFTGTISSDGGVLATVDTSLGGAAYSPAPLKSVSGAFTRARFYQRFTVPAGTTSMAARLTAHAGTGYVAFGQISVYNATRLQMVL